MENGGQLASGTSSGGGCNAANAGVFGYVVLMFLAVPFLRKRYL